MGKNKKKTNGYYSDYDYYDEYEDMDDQFFYIPEDRSELYSVSNTRVVLEKVTEEDVLGILNFSGKQEYRLLKYKLKLLNKLTMKNNDKYRVLNEYTLVNKLSSFIITKDYYDETMNRFNRIRNKNVANRFILERLVEHYVYNIKTHKVLGMLDSIYAKNIELYRAYLLLKHYYDVENVKIVDDKVIIGLKIDKINALSNRVDYINKRT